MSVSDWKYLSETERKSEKHSLNYILINLRIGLILFTSQKSLPPWIPNVLLDFSKNELQGWSKLQDVLC